MNIDQVQIIYNLKGTMRSLFSFFILCLVLFIQGISCEEYDLDENFCDNPKPICEDHSSSGDETLFLYDTGPVTIDTPITFVAGIHNETEVPSVEYRFKFDQFPQHDKTIVSTARRVRYPVTIDSSTAKAGNYSVQVEVWFCQHGVPSISLGTLRHNFQISDSLIGYIRVEHERFFANIIPSGAPIKLTAEIRDPSGYFFSPCETPPFNITYKWIINGVPQVENLYDQTFSPIFSQAQLNNISVTVTASKTIGNRLIQRSGFFKITLISKDSVSNLTIEGDTKIKLHEQLQLNATIQRGTPRFRYCWSFIQERLKSVCGYTNGSFTINKSFSEKGTKTLEIIYTNHVSLNHASFEISVY